MIRGSQHEFSKNSPASLNPSSFTVFAYKHRAMGFAGKLLADGQQVVLDARGRHLVAPCPQSSHLHLCPKSGWHTDASPSSQSLPVAQGRQTLNCTVRSGFTKVGIV